MISDEITDSLVSLLKVSYKNKISISVESLYYFKENQKWRKPKRTDKIPAKTLQSAGTLACVRSRMNWSFSSQEIFVFKNIFFWSGMINM